MTHIDAAILNLTESCCRKFQLLTGRTNVWLAVQFTNLSVIVYFVWTGLFFWRSALVLRIAVGVFCGALLYVLTQTIFKVSVEAAEQNAYRRVARGFRNPRRLRDAPLRISFLTLSIVLLYPTVLAYGFLHLRIVLLSYLLIALTSVVLYVLACDPLPPCPGIVREWLRRSIRRVVPEAARLLSEGTWTHDHPITFEAAKQLGLPVNPDIPSDVLALMSLYPQPTRRQPTVEYLPGRRLAEPPDR